MLRREKKDFAGSLKDLNRVLSLDPNQKNAYAQRALLFETMDQPKKALKDLDKYLLLNPGDVEMRFMRVNLSLNTNDLRRALLDLNALIAGKQKTRALSLRGLAFLERGHIDLALADLNRVIAGGSSDPTDYIARGDALISKFRLAEAEKDFDTVLALREGFPEARREKMRLRILRALVVGYPFLIFLCVAIAWRKVKYLTPAALAFTLAVLAALIAMYITPPYEIRFFGLGVHSYEIALTIFGGLLLIALARKRRRQRANSLFLVSLGYSLGVSICIVLFRPFGNDFYFTLLGWLSVMFFEFFVFLALRNSQRIGAWLSARRKRIAEPGGAVPLMKNVDASLLCEKTISEE
jgi:tetratricopeptide (TPR) repeat protein